jgi:hypothetical protein
MPVMKHVAMFSGGIGSWSAARRVAERNGTDNLTLLFSDTLIEDNDLYRFLIEGAANVFGLTVNPALSGAPRLLPQVYEDFEERRQQLEIIRNWAMLDIPGLVWQAEGRQPWEVFHKERYLANTRVDPCSKILKREMADRWISDNLEPDSSIIYVGIDWSEAHRYTGLRDRRFAVGGWRYEAPMTEPPLIDKADMLAALEFHGIKVPELYDLGFAHNNCGGFCVKSGMSQFKRLLEVKPELYAYHEAEEERLRQFLNKDVAILRDRRGGTSKPLTMTALRKRVEAAVVPVPTDEWGGCGCFLDDDDDKGVDAA